MTLWKNIRKWSKKSQQTKSDFATSFRKRSLSSDLQTNIDQIKEEFGSSPDVIIREFLLGTESVLKVAMIYMDGLVNKNAIFHFVGHFLNGEYQKDWLANANPHESLLHFLRNHAHEIHELRTIETWNEMMLSCLSGDTVILIDGSNNGIGGNTRGGELRQISESTTQVVIRGPKDAFIESIGTNIALVRRRIKNPNLWLENMEIGKVTRTDVAILYLHGIAKEDLIKDIKKRLLEIEIDSIMESGNIEELIEDQTFTPFPTIYNTDRPDIIAANIIEGRVAIFVDGTPFVLIVPTIFSQFFQSAEDYYQRFDFATFVRLLRYVSFFISVMGPSIYIALITFHQEMIPSQLLFSLVSSREGVPFPALVEALMMELSFEILREAGVRMPRSVGQAVSIVGALVLGQAAVQAGIVSPAMVIVVAITGIASFATPAFNIAITARMLRFVLMILAASFGAFGITMGMIFIVAHMTSLQSFGTPYLSPLGPFNIIDQKDTFIRFPLWSVITRSKLFRVKKYAQTSKETPSALSNHGERNGDGAQ
ncbi:spore germination protein [Paenibacillus radicis (ex Xue et al. 2023)]|uniref:Spore germination protein n=1 Tax=Paenibacillus radicis (ex Xue et al. 2023) TaxID=2972489 RepID=A0ABT1YRU6_9BACL|nr:spore germination protein [Paenibacillus radicis (ex Xue et al. 2023)]MCR8634710.1 spore germination protein [Paenibacillus radicis (ex Xue et al. 2023)]